MSVADLRTLLDPLVAVMSARPLWRQVPQSSYTPPATPDNPSPSPVVTPAHTAVYTDPATLPPEILAGGNVDLGAQLSLVQAALGRFADLQIRTVTAATTYAPATPWVWTSGQSYDIPLTWLSAPLAAVKGAVARVDASVVAAGRIQASVLDSSVSQTGCTVRCTAGGSGTFPITIGTPLTVSATGLYLFWPAFQG